MQSPMWDCPIEQWTPPPPMGILSPMRINLFNNTVNFGNICTTIWLFVWVWIDCIKNNKNVKHCPLQAYKTLLNFFNFKCKYFHEFTAHFHKKNHTCFCFFVCEGLIVYLLFQLMNGFCHLFCFVSLLAKFFFQSSQPAPGNHST